MNGCLTLIGVAVLILVGLAALNFLVWAAVTFFPYAIMALLVVCVVIVGFAGTRY